MGPSPTETDVEPRLTVTSLLENRRVCFVWTDAGPDVVEIVDYH